MRKRLQDMWTRVLRSMWVLDISGGVDTFPIINPGEIPDYLDVDVTEGETQELALASNKFLAHCHVYEYQKADNTTDAVVFGADLNLGVLQVLLIKRGREGEPFYGSWALPGGFLNMDEDLDTCVARELDEECHVQVAYLEQLYTFGKPGRDPRGRVISTAYWALVRPDQLSPRADDDAEEFGWFDIKELPELAFDHDKIIQMALGRLRTKLVWAPVGFELLPKEFTLTDIQNIYEVILGREISLKALRHRMNKFGVLEATGKASSDVGRPPILYRFNKEAYQRLQEEGIDFEV